MCVRWVLSWPSAFQALLWSERQHSPCTNALLLSSSAVGLSQQRFAGTLYIDCVKCGRRAHMRDSVICAGCRESCFCTAQCALDHVLLTLHGGATDASGSLPQLSMSCSQACSDLQSRTCGIVSYWRSQPAWPLVRAVCRQRNGSVASVPVHVRLALDNIGLLPSALFSGLTVNDMEVCVYAPHLVQRSIAVAEKAAATSTHAARCGTKDLQRIRTARERRGVDRRRDRRR